MAGITRLLPGRWHRRSGPTTWTRHVARGRVRHEGVGLAYGFAPRSAVHLRRPRRVLRRGEADRLTAVRGQRVTIGRDARARLRLVVPPSA